MRQEETRSEDLISSLNGNGHAIGDSSTSNIVQLLPSWT